MKGDDIASRLLEFAARILDVIAGLPQTVLGKHIARQLTRAATSGGANYEEARGAESRADFAHKVQVSAKEVRESVYWVKLIQRMALRKPAWRHALAPKLPAFGFTPARPSRWCEAGRG